MLYTLYIKYNNFISGWLIHKTKMNIDYIQREENWTELDGHYWMLDVLHGKILNMKMFIYLLRVCVCVCSILRIYLVMKIRLFGNFLEGLYKFNIQRVPNPRLRMVKAHPQALAYTESPYFTWDSNRLKNIQCPLVNAQTNFEIYMFLYIYSKCKVISKFK